MNPATRIGERVGPWSEARTLTAESLCAQYAGRVFQFASMVCKDSHGAEDLAQEALVRAVTRLHTFNPSRGTLEAWLWRIVVNVARDAGRVARRDRALFERLRLHQSQPAVDEEDFTSIQDEELLGAIRSLDARSRAVIALRFGADLDYAAVGAALGISPAAAGIAGRRALARLRAHLEERR